MGQYMDRYAEYLENLQKDITCGKQGSRRPLLGFCSNADVVLSWDAAVYNDILRKHLHTQPGQGRNEQIGSMADFARISSWYITQGIGGNMDISSPQVCDELLAAFLTERALGGTGAQAAAALGAIGIPADVHLTDRSRPVCDMLSGKGIMMIENGSRIPVEACQDNASPVYHFILQFRKDDIIEINGEKHRIPCSNRLILFYDPIHRLLPIGADYCSYYEQNPQNLTSYLLSGFDAVVDTSVIEDRLEMLAGHIATIKERNPLLVCYLEGAFYLNPEVKTRVMRRLSPMMDIVGMNEEELAEQMQDFGNGIILTDPQQVLSGLDKLRSIYGMRGIVLHTKDYALYYGKHIAGCDLEKGLTIGNLMAATRARLGKYGTARECQGTLALPLSAAGTAFAEKLPAAATLPERECLIVVPSRYMEHPRYTIGLGDTFTAGVQSCFIP